jgi:pantoate--beta-alanine ligase
MLLGPVHFIFKINMKIAKTIDALRAEVPTPCAFVPTMGNLHQGHLALVRKAQQHKLPVVVSIFVNRLQFAPHEDFDQYPRTLEHDLDLLRQIGTTVVFAPSEAELFPQPQSFKVTPDPSLSEILEGYFRPGFFTGVSTIVMKLFQCIQPRVAVFGKKDYQQLKVIEQMVQQFCLPITIEGLDTHRAPDGLALSSRNGYLSASDRAQAIDLPQALQALAQQYRKDPQNLTLIENLAMKTLKTQGWEPDYLTVRRRDNLLPPDLKTAPAPLVVLGAARLGTTRLIDNFEF